VLRLADDVTFNEPDAAYVTPGLRVSARPGLYRLPGSSGHLVYFGPTTLQGTVENMDEHAARLPSR
jgi:hypothetical protein